MKHGKKESINLLTDSYTQLFFGNMIYDLFLFQSNFKNKEFLWVDFIAATLLVFYFIVDYIHLYADMNDLVDNSSKKSKEYLLCDIAASFFFFISFIGIKENIHWVSWIFLPLIPGMIYSYKRNNIQNIKCNKYFLLFFRLSAFFAIVIGVTTFLLDINLIFEEAFLLLSFIALSLFVHCRFVFWFYEKFGKENDDKFMKTAKVY